MTGDTDQRGYARSVGNQTTINGIVRGPVDIGAVEMQANEFTNNAPVANPAVFTTVHDQTLTVAAAAGLKSFATDADNDDLTAVAIDGKTWAIGVPYPTPLGGSIVVQADGSFVYTPPLLTIGDETFTYTVSDNYSSATADFIIHVTDNAPTAGDLTFWLNVNQSISISANEGLLSSASDPDGDTPTIATVNGQSLVNGSITVQNGSGSTLTVYADGSFDYVPAQDSLAVDEFTFTITDGILDASAFLTIRFYKNVG